MRGIIDGFPDFRVEHGDVFTDGNEAMTTLHITGTHEAEFMGIPPTNQAVELVGMAKIRVANGKLQELHDVINMQALLMQLGVAEG
jgi:C-1 hydroxylase